LCSCAGADFDPTQANALARPQQQTALSKKPNERVLIDMIAALVGRVVKGPSTPREVPRELRQAVRDRLRMAEPAARIAQAYGVDVDTIKRVGA
jgi:hypothetical protein